MKHLNKQNNLIYLFFSLIILLFSSAVVVQFPSSLSYDVFSLVILLMLVVSHKSVHTDATWKWTTYTIIAIFSLLTILAKFITHELSVYLILFTLLIFFISAFTTSVKQILFVGDIDTHKIIGSLTLYILLGLIWAVIYLIILAMDPQAFSGIEAGNWQQMFSRVAYYSFITLTTLGYGDVLPTNHIAEFFAYMEAIVGVFYMAIIVSSLISLRLAAIEEEKKRK